jgi:Secretion system C-terminal sorting domain
MHNMKILFYFFFAAISLQNAMAQSTIDASTGNASGSGGKASYSVGQVLYTTSTGTGGTSNQGIQQAFEIVTLGNDSFPEITLSMSVYPNPTTSIINLKVNDFNFENLQFILTDMAGKQLQFRKITEVETQIQMENLPQSIYFLNVSDGSKQLKTFKIIKK